MDVNVVYKNYIGNGMNSIIQEFRKSGAKDDGSVICFSFAGGGANSFCDWGSYLPANIGLYAVRLPGRETRMNEEPHNSLSDLLDELSNDNHFKQLISKPLFLYGHSLGALIAYELACRLKLLSNPNLLSLIVSGRVAPQCALNRPPIHNLSDKEFIGSLKSLGGTPEEVLSDEKLMNVLIPILRADFSINENYVYRDREKLSCNISAFGGLVDSEVTRAQMNQWKEVTDGNLNVRMIPGDHFFIRSAKTLFLRMLSIEIINQLKLFKQKT
ncbi:thioesterase [Alteromonadaceae bacterium M269]|nr:thioesterase [Alteromonadaceae bacterium M269]